MDQEEIMAKSENKYKTIKFLLGCVCSAIFIIIFINQMKGLDIAQLTSMSLGWHFVVLSVICYMLSQIFRAMSWSYGALPAIRLGPMIKSIFMGNGANMVLPFRVGDVARVVLVSNKKERHPQIVTTTIVLERIVDIGILIALAISLPFFVPLYPSVEVQILRLRMVILVGGGLFLVFLFVFRLFLWKISLRWVQRYKGVSGWLTRFKKVPVYTQPSRLIPMTFWLMISWLFVYISIYVGIQSVTVDEQGLLAALLVLVFTNLGLLLPAAPGGVGIFQYVTLMALTLIHVPLAEATVLSIVLHLIQYAALLPSALIFLLDHRYRKKEERL